MSWSLNCQYACLQLDSISSREELDQLLTEFAKSVWAGNAGKTGDEVDFIFLEEGLPDTFDEAKEVLLPELWKQVKSLRFIEGTASLVVSTDAVDDAYYTDINDALIEFLFSKSGASHFLMRSAAFDNLGGYSHQWIGYWKDGEIVSESTEEYFARIFQQSPAPVLTAS